MPRKPKDLRPLHRDVCGVRYTIRATSRDPKPDGRRYFTADPQRAAKDAGHKRHALGWHLTSAAALIDFSRRIEPQIARDAERSNATRFSTLADLVRAWLANEVDPSIRPDGVEGSREDRAPLTVREYHRRADRVLAWDIASVPLASFGDADVKAYIRARRRSAKPPAPNTLAAEVSLIRAAWAWGRRTVEGMAALPELKTAIKDPMPVRPKPIPTAADVARVLDCMTLDWPRDVVTLLWAWGARIHEVNTLTTESVDWDRGVVRLWGKGDKPREVPLEVPGVEQTAAILARRCAGVRPGARIWPVGEYSVRSGIARYHLTNACEAAGVERFTPHALRRAAINRLLRSVTDDGRGVQLLAVAELAGHTPETMGRHYTVINQQDMDTVLRAGAEAARLPAPESPDVVDLEGVRERAEYAQPFAHAANDTRGYCVSQTPRRSSEDTEDPRDD